MSSPAGMRWWIPPPAADETLRSVLERAAALYHWEPQMLWRALNGDNLESSGSIDQPSCHALVRLGQALGMPALGLRQHCVPDVPWRLDPMARHAVCPICWDDAVMGDNEQAELRSWTHVLRTRCPIHEAPLCLPVSRHHAGTDATKLAALAAEDLEVLSLIERFGTVLEQSLFFGAPWPSDWRGGAWAARQLLVKVSSYDGEGSGHALIANVAPSEALTPFIHGGRHLSVGGGRQDWERFRRISDPAIRRAALWAVAWMRIPGLPQRLSPGWGMDNEEWIRTPAGGS